jgi:hypothetical protein
MARYRALDLHWTALLNDFRRSGLTHAEFCARRGFSLHTFRKHLYADHLPLYRQEGIFRRHGVAIARSTMCDWMAVSAELLAPVVRLMTGEVFRSRIVQSDDTPVPAQDPGGQGVKAGRLWASVGDHDHPYVVYHYTPDRTRAGPDAIFRGFEGYLWADAYPGL